MPERVYLKCLLEDLALDLECVPMQSVSSIFFGGGTPSLFSAKFYGDFLDELAGMVYLNQGLEITLEANPGTLECAPLCDYLSAGVNRLSLGVQSLNSTCLEKLGRIHDAQAAHQAIKEALSVGFGSVNLDMMYGLPGQDVAAALEDLNALLVYEPEHISWYQLTIEPNTVFYKSPPVLADEDVLCDMNDAGVRLLQGRGYQRYEVSAFSKREKQCRHNLNYWRYGDYIGLGAGAHGKITNNLTQEIFRSVRTRVPTHYLSSTVQQRREIKPVSSQDQIFEFFLNHLRLFEPIAKERFLRSTTASLDDIAAVLVLAQNRGWLQVDKEVIRTTRLGQQFLNPLIACFLP